MKEKLNNIIPTVTPALTDEEKVEAIKWKLNNRVEYLKTKLQMKLQDDSDDDVVKEHL